MIDSDLIYFSIINNMNLLMNDIYTKKEAYDILLDKNMIKLDDSDIKDEWTCDICGISDQPVSLIDCDKYKNSLCEHSFHNNCVIKQLVSDRFTCPKCDKDMFCRCAETIEAIRQIKNYSSRFPSI